MMNSTRQLPFLTKQESHTSSSTNKLQNHNLGNIFSLAEYNVFRTLKDDIMELYDPVVLQQLCHKINYCIQLGFYWQ